VVGDVVVVVVERRRRSCCLRLGRAVAHEVWVEGLVVGVWHACGGDGGGGGEHYWLWVVSGW